MTFSTRWLCAVLLTASMAAAHFLFLGAPEAAQPTVGPARLTLRQGDRIVFVGNTFAEREHHYGYFEALLQARFPELKLTVRNLGYSGDEVNNQPRPLNFGDVDKHLTDQKADVIFLCFGMNESFQGEAGLADFEKGLADIIKSYSSKKFNGTTPPRLVLVSPTAHEDVGGHFPNPNSHNEALAKYVREMKRLAAKYQLPFIDLFPSTLSLMQARRTPLTINGIHLNAYGYWAAAHLMMDELGWPTTAGKFETVDALRASLSKRLPSPPAPVAVGVIHPQLVSRLPVLELKNLQAGVYALCLDGFGCAYGTAEKWAKGVTIEKSPAHNAAEELRLAIVARNRDFFYRWRAVNGEYIYGRRAKPFGVVNFPAEMKQLDERCAALDAQIHKLAPPRPLVSAEMVRSDKVLCKSLPTVVDTLTPQPIEKVYNQKPGWIGGKFHPTAADPEKERELFVLPEGYEINLFASEQDFPLHNPVAMQFDSKGRLWVATMPSYPHAIPGEPPDDKILILEDTKGAGKADKYTVFADRLYLPTGFEFYDGGVIVAAQPNILFLKDTKRTGKADLREIILHGFGTGDSHHAIHAFNWGPDGGLYFGEGTFHRSMVETPHGPVRLFESGWFRFQPRNHKLDVFVRYPFANPWGQVFDRWGQNFIADASGGSNYFGLPLTGYLEHPKQHPPMKVFTTVVRPTCGCEIVASSHFPPEAQGNFLVNNNIGFQGIKQHKVIEDGSGFTSKEVPPLLFSKDPYFRPVAILFGPDGALYVCDWFNPIVGHMQFSLRDPNRNHFHGRIWRITAKGRPLVTPAKIDGEPVEKLLDLLKVYEDRTRYRVRSELRTRLTKEVTAALKTWVAKLDKNDPKYEHHCLEALWVWQNTPEVNADLLKQLLRAKDYHARAAATRALRHWHEQIPDWLDLMEVQANDAHPRVRLEAVIALSYSRDARAAEIALEAVKYPTDYYLDYGIKETVRALEPYWQPFIASGKPFCINNVAGANYILGKVSTADLVKMARSAPVYLALLSRENVLPQYRLEALEGLAKLNKTDAVTEAFAAIERIDQGDHVAGGHVLHDLAHLLTQRKASELSTIRTRLEKLAASARQPITRQVMFVTLITADGSLDKTWMGASKSITALRDLVDAVPLIADPKLRATAYPKVEPLLTSIPADLAKQAKSTGIKGRLVRIDLPYPNRTLSLAEVQVFSGGQNIALRGKATQKTTASGGNATRAIDGNTSGIFTEGSVTHTQEGDLSPWWEVDLLVERPIDAIVVWNRTDAKLGQRLDGFRVTVKDMHGTVVFQKDNNPAPPINVKFTLSTDPAGDLHRAAMRAIASIPGKETVAFTKLARFIVEGTDRDTAIRALRGIPRPSWPKDQVRPLLDGIARYLTKLTVQEKTEAPALDALQLGNDLASLLPLKEAAKARALLGELGVNVVLVRAVPHRMEFDRKRIFVEAGKPVVIVFENTDIMQHNLLIGAPDSLTEIGTAADKMANEPDAFARNFIPKHPKVLWSTRMLQPREIERLQFTAPKQLGEYPFVCTFPGHWRVMYGTMVVVPKLSEVPIEDLQPTTEIAEVRPFVKNWSMEEIVQNLDKLDQGRSFEKGKVLFGATACVTCHKMQNQGGIVGPDLAELPMKLANKTFSKADIVRELVYPSKVINEKFKSWIIETIKGEVVTGVIVAADDKVIQVMTGPNQKPRDIALTDIDSKREAKVSMMPEGLLVTLQMDEILDLLAYLVAGGDASHPMFRQKE